MSYFNNQVLQDVFTNYMTWVKKDYEEVLGRPLREDDYDDFIQKTTTEWDERYDICWFLENEFSGDYVALCDYFSTNDILGLVKQILQYFCEIDGCLDLPAILDRLLSFDGVMRYALYVEMNSIADITIYFAKKEEKYYCYCVKHYGEEECCVCLETSMNCYTGCGHTICKNCDERLLGNKCPVCRQETNICVSCSGIRLTI